MCNLKNFQNLDYLPQDAAFIKALDEKIEIYLNLLQKWNQAYNLTAIRDKEQMLSKHILDSLAILPWLNGENILDVGSGAGLPGIPLALARPNLQIYLLDSNGKKTRFLQEVKRVLQLENITIIQARVEEYLPNLKFDTIVSRAFTSLKNILDKTYPLLIDGGIWLTMKGLFPEQELLEIKRPYKIEQYQIAGSTANRCCIIIKK